MQAKDQLQSAHHGRTVSIAARVTRVFHGFVAASRQSAGFFGANDGGVLTRRRYSVSALRGIIVGSSLTAFAAEATAGDASTQLEATTQVAPLARIEPGALAITSASERGRYSFDKGALQVETSAEGAGEAVAKVLQPPAIGHPQLEAAIGIVQFAFSPFAAAYGAITSGNHKLTAQQLAEAEQRVAEAMHKMVEQDQLRQLVFQCAPEKTHRRLVELAADGARFTGPFSGSLETQIEALQLRSTHKNDQNYQLTIRARARLSKTSKDQVVAERSYEYTSGEAMFIDWSRAGGLESVALTGFRQIAEDIVRDFCSPTLEAPIFLGAAYGNPAARPAQQVRLARRTAPGPPQVQFVDYQVTANNPFEVFPDMARAEVMIHEPKNDVSSDSQTDTEWAMDGLVNHRNFVVQAGACLAAVPMGIWEQTVGAIGRKSQENLSAAGDVVQRVVWKTPLQQNLAGDIARTLAPQTAQPVLLRKLPSASGEGSPTGDLIRISSVGDVALDGQTIQIRPETALEVQVTKVELSGNHGSKRQPSLSLEAKVTLLRTSDGQELFTWPVRYSSGPHRISAWSAHDGAQVEQELRQCSRQMAEAIVGQLLREGCVAPGRMPASAIAKN
jgi:hypothetical protein